MYGLPRCDNELTPRERRAIRRLGIEASGSVTRVAFAQPVAFYELDPAAEIAETFALANREHATGHSTEREPLPCATTAPGGGIGHVAPMLIGQHSGSVARNVLTSPAQTVAAEGAIASVEPTLVKMNASETSAFNDATRPVSQTMRTIVPKTCLGFSTPVAPEPMIDALYGANGSGKTAHRTRPTAR